MSRKARREKQTRRNLVNIDDYAERYYKRYVDARRKTNSDKHMSHLWLSEFVDRTFGETRKRAPFHKGRKP